MKEQSSGENRLSEVHGEETVGSPKERYLTTIRGQARRNYFGAFQIKAASSTSMKSPMGQSKNNVGVGIALHNVERKYPL